MPEWTTEKWRDFVEALKDKRWSSYEPVATDPQCRYLAALSVPQHVIRELTVSEASNVIKQRLAEKEQERAARAKLKAEEAEHKRQARELQKKIEQHIEKQKRKAQMQDVKTGLTGTDPQIQWADRIRTSLTPYLTKLHQCAKPGSDERTVIEHALKQDDAGSVSTLLSSALVR